MSEKPSYDELERKVAKLSGMETALRESEERFRLFYENSPVPYQSLNAEGFILDINPAWLGVLGYSREEVVGHWFGDFLPEDMKEVFKERFPEFKRVGNIFGAEFEMICSDGSTKIVAFDGKIGVDQEGQFKQTYCVFRDSTAQKKAEEALETMVQQWEISFNAISDPLCLLNNDGQIIRFNKAMKNFIGKEDREILTRRCWEVLHQTDRPIPECPFPRMLVSLKRESSILSVGERVLNVSVDPVIDKKGKLAGAVHIISDITEAKKAEEERISWERKLAAVQKMESLGLLAGGIAHDFNNLLTAILGNVDLALFDLPPESSVLPRIKDLKKATLHLAELTSQMLAFSGKGTVEFARINLSKLTSEIAHLLKVAISKKATIKFDLLSDLPPIAADASQLRQVIMNLILNASDSLHDGEGIISLSTTLIEADEGYLSEFFPDHDLLGGSFVCLEVSDTGCGMSEETKEKVFDPFFTTKETGRGLGLAAVLGIVRGHNGALKVYTEPMHGTSIKILLPAADLMEGLRSEASNRDMSLRPEGRILVVDDEESVRSTARLILEKGGFKVTVAESGNTAVEVIRREGETISAVLLDLTMPGMDGIETFDSIRQIRPDIPVILSSGYNQTRAMKDLMGRESVGFIQKPYEAQNLINRFSEIISKK